MGELKSGTDESLDIVPGTSSDSGSGLLVLFTCQDGSEASWLGLLLTSASVIEAAGAITTLSEGGEDSEICMD
jgi:hypothetical protein